MNWNIRVSTEAGVFDLLDVPSKDCKMSHGTDGVPVAYAGNPVIKRKSACDPKVAAGSEYFKKYGTACE
tara:strand:- start:226 stop:432 length:207 start_codon:yes stop_codon:yes gene_type:complete